MVDARFDRFARRVAQPTPRRATMRWLGAVVLASAGIASDRGSLWAKRPFTCAEGGNPCHNGSQTACCSPGQYCCNRKTDNPVCLASKQECDALP